MFKEWLIHKLGGYTKNDIESYNIWVSGIDFKSNLQAAHLLGEYIYEKRDMDCFHDLCEGYTYGRIKVLRR